LGGLEKDLFLMKPMVILTGKSLLFCLFFHSFFHSFFLSLVPLLFSSFAHRSLFDHTNTWWEARGLTNVLFLHYGDMSADTAGTIREIAAFLDISLQEDLLPGILQAVTMEGMRSNLLYVPAFLFFL
jgi:hypothetical protein